MNEKLQKKGNKGVSFSKKLIKQYFSNIASKCYYQVSFKQVILQVNFNPLSANPTEWSNTLKQFIHFWGWRLKN